MAGINFQSLSGWKISAVITVLVLTLPIIFVVSNSLTLDIQSWQQTLPKLLPLYIKNTFFLLSGIVVLTLLIGVGTAWLVTVYNFPFRKQLEWVLILPLSIPTFINGIAYVGLTDYAGPLRILLRWMGNDVYIDIMNHWGAIIIMSLVLYPYVYVASRAAFYLQSASLIEVSRSLGRSINWTFIKVAVPIAWPVIFSGLLLVIMEVVNDYGVVQYFGIPTFTTGIFRAWLALGDLSTAVLLSMIVLVFIVMLVLFDVLIQHGKKLTNENEDRIFSRVSHPRKWLAFFMCFIPIIFGFMVPVGQMIWWAILASSKDVWYQSFKFMGNSSFLGLLSATIIILLSIILSYSYRVSSKLWFSKILMKVPMLGYAVPGAVIGIGIVSLIIGLNPNWIYSGTIALTFGYTTRFFAVGYGQIEEGLEKIPLQLDYAASSLGKNSMSRLIKIHVPILKPVLVGAFIMVFVDVVKELPLTLILRPFNFETLATNAFQYAKDEMAPKSAASSLLIIFVSSIPVYFLNKLLNK